MEAWEKTKVPGGHSYCAEVIGTSMPVPDKKSSHYVMLCSAAEYHRQSAFSAMPCIFFLNVHNSPEGCLIYTVIQGSANKSH